MNAQRSVQQVLYQKFKMKKILLFLFASLFVSVHAQSDKEWAFFRGEKSLTGFTKAATGDKFSMHWNYKTNGGIKSSPVVADNKVFIGSNDGSVYAFDLGGELLWTYNTEVSVEAPPLYLDGVIYVGNLEGIIFAINADDGSLKWKFTTDGQISGGSSWVWSPDKKSKWIITGSYDYFLYCVDAETGELIWKFEADNYINSAPGTDGEICMIGGCDGYLHMININDGVEKDKIDAGTYVASSAAIVDNKAFYGNYDGDFYCADMITKENVWHFTAGPFTGSPSIANGKVVIGSQDKHVYCFDQKTGKVLWKYMTQRKIEGSPVIAKDKVIIGSGDGRVYMLNLSDGSRIAAYEIGRAIVGSPAVIEDHVIIGALDGRIYCLKTNL
ncbi:MAG: hypothetical protein CL663_00495 [Bacteroidetes bacterium]|nr:hypothetical protein [Bacteroidota bacterium]